MAEGVSGGREDGCYTWCAAARWQRSRARRTIIGRRGTRMLRMQINFVGVITDRQRLLVQTAESLARRFQLDVRTRHEAVRIDRDRKELEVRDLRQGRTYREPYDVLILSPGSVPVRPKIPGADGPRVFVLRNIPDMDAIADIAARRPAGRAVVIGGGFVGLEMAENLHRRGIGVELVEAMPQVLASLDREMVALVHAHLRRQGVGLHLAAAVTAIGEAGEGVEVVLAGGKRLAGDFVILAAGVKPEVELAREAGLALGPHGAIAVDERLQTLDPSIYAIGDAVEVKSLVTGAPTWLPLAGPANRQGRLVADAIYGREVRYPGVLGTSIVKVFELTVASVGLNERAAAAAGLPFAAAIVHPNAHAGYYPGAMPLTLKLLFTPAGRLLGAQAVGYEGVDKRIDVIATAMRFGASVEDLAGLELAYAPPYSSAKDPVNMAGYVAGNVVRGDVAQAYWHEIAGLDPQKTILLDVREPEEREAGFIPGSVNIPLDQLRDRLGELPAEKEIVAYCQVGFRAYLAARILAQHGRRVRNLSGGYRTYRAVMEDLAAIDGSSSGMAAPAAPKATVPSAAERTEILDACGLQCPGPIIRLRAKMETMAPGEILEVHATDPGFLSDVQAWVSRTGHALLRAGREGDRFVAVLRKGGTEGPRPAGGGGNDKTIVVFSGDLDRAIASFIIANGAAAMGRRVTMFFTFWGLNVLRRPRRVKLRKGLLERAFGWMMPRGSTRLGLSKMNMMGLGPRMIRFIMRRKNVSSLEELIDQARAAGVRLVACQMLMDLMGIKREELIDGVEVGGVASYLAAAEEGDVNLFI
ncbi:MAG: DsrE/DsrF/DrsH-like family protein [Firmicutes bacterium]|nr:DsrE/DsrF/DrsH-like family protein [Bacillota bacterium]